MAGTKTQVAIKAGAFLSLLWKTKRITMNIFRRILNWFKSSDTLKKMTVEELEAEYTRIFNKGVLQDLNALEQFRLKVLDAELGDRGIWVHCGATTVQFFRRKP